MKILGISYSGNHDTSCALVIDEQLKFAISEERLTRRKQDGSFPINSVRAALAYGGLTPDDIDYVVIAWSHPLRQLWFDTKQTITTDFSLKSLGYTLKSRLSHLWIRGGFRRYEQYFGKSKFIFCDHHLAHALSSYAYSGFKEATVVVVDGRGAFEATSIWKASNGSIEPVEIFNWPNSLGLFYAKFTKYLGFTPLSDEWKVMGLAPYGNDGVDLSGFISADHPYNINWQQLLGAGMSDVSGISSILGQPASNGNYLDDKFKDIAYAVQRDTEKAMISLCSAAIKRTGINNLCLAGGVALNCKANGMISNNLDLEDIFIQPASSDEGAALGAAMYPYLLINKKLPRVKMEDAYLGLSYSDDEIEKTIKNYKLRYEKLQNPSKTGAKLIADRNIIGLFQGRMEFGPRALGNRSIIADPRDVNMKDKVNDSVKYRENWRPFAPSFLSEYFHDYFETRFDSPFMILSFPVKKDKQKFIPAATHVDGTARPQTVTEQSNPFYWDMINEFYKKTGVPSVLNTSFNLKGEPVVCTPYDAIRTFYTSGMDYLLIGSFLISKS